MSPPKVITFVRFFPSDWLAATRPLNPTETGIYMTLFALILDRQEPISMDENRLARYINADVKEMKEAIVVLQDEGLIQRTNDGLWSEDAGELIEQARAKSQKASESAGKRWNGKEVARRI